MDSYNTVPGEYAGPRNVGSGSYNSNFYRRLIAAALSVSMLLPASGLEAKVSNPLSSEPKAGVSRKISDSNIPTGYITLKGPDGKIIVSKEIVPSLLQHLGRLATIDELKAGNNYHFDVDVPGEKERRVRYGAFTSFFKIDRRNGTFTLKPTSFDAGTTHEATITLEYDNGQKYSFRLNFVFE